MKRPNVSDEKYKLSNDFECIKFHPSGYLADVNKHIDQIEAEKKELIDTMENLMRGIDGLPSLTAIQGVLEKEYTEAENLIKKLKQS